MEDQLRISLNILRLSSSAYNGLALPESYGWQAALDLKIG